MRGLLSVLAALFIAVISSCGSVRTPVQSAIEPRFFKMDALRGLPADGVQPWEELDERGYVLPLANRNTSAFSGDSLFAPGIERFLEGGDVIDNGEASTMTSAAGSVSYGIYRFTLGGVQPSAIAADANLHEVDGVIS